MDGGLCLRHCTGVHVSYSYMSVAVPQMNLKKRLQRRDAIIAAKKKQLQIFIGYIIELEDDNWYVGISSRGTYRLYEHFCGFGSKWTKLHRPLKVHTITYVGDRETAGRWEKENTLSLMYKKGWEKVRGYHWCHLVMERPKALVSWAARKLATDFLN